MWQAIWPWLAPMLALLFFSALFSGSEAALFSLSAKDKRSLARGPIGGRIAVKLLDAPEKLLSAVLFWNLLINMTYFAITAIVGAKLEKHGSAAVVAFTGVTLLTIIFFGEMLPKSIAVLSPRRISQLAAPLMALAVKALSPVLPLVSFSNTAAQRLLWPNFSPEKDLEVADIERAIEFGSGDAALAARERAALRQLMQLTTTRVDEWMLPRSHLRLNRPPITKAVLNEGVPPSGYLLIAEPNAEEIIASIAVRTLRPSQMDSLESSAEPVIYVPWSSSVASAFDSLQGADRSVAAIVNEYGDTIGILTIDVILEGILRLHAGRPPEEGSEAHFEVVAPGVWRVSGMMSVRRLAEHLGAPPPESRNVTIAGLMQEENERFPREGDWCRWGRFHLEVIEAKPRGRVRIEIRKMESEDDEP